MVDRYAQIVTQEFRDMLAEAVHDALEEAGNIHQVVSAQNSYWRDYVGDIMPVVIRTLIDCYTSRIMMYGPPPPNWGMTTGNPVPDSGDSDALAGPRGI
jgi:hypothetical protein